MNGPESKLRSITHSLAVVVFCLYAPFSWLFLIDYPGTSYRLFWIRLRPILPGFLAGSLPGPLLYGHHLPYEFTTMGVTTIILLIGLTWFGFLGRKRLLAAAGFALLISLPSAYVAYAMFRA